jgi:hypothetical protein
MMTMTLKSCLMNPMNAHLIRITRLAAAAGAGTPATMLPDRLALLKAR